uniref:Uncharacterized protein n=1 Tax=Anguilla anguilla TaxID=7936 RepID=A0A0E9XJK0_ANGAN
MFFCFCVIILVVQRLKCFCKLVFCNHKILCISHIECTVQSCNIFNIYTTI